MTLSKNKLAQSLSSRISGQAKNLGVSAALLLCSANASALGLGSLEIKSNLDQPLRGTIELRIAQGDDLDTVTAQIASREDFESLGIEYPSYLKDFSVVLSAVDSQRFLRVSSNDIIIKEPFIHFLVRVEWSGGSFLREYTALIDPPVYSAEAPSSISEPKEVGQDQTYQVETPVTPKVVNENTLPAIASEPPAVEQASVEENADAVAAETASEASNFQTDSASQSTDAAYGPVASGESLGKIAEELQRQFPDLSIFQIMKVLFEENTSSFIGGNINGLMQGSILKIGDLNAIRAVDIAESKEFFAQQIDEWNPQLLQSSESDALNVGQDNYSFQNESTSNLGASDVDDYSTQDSFQVGASAESNDYVSSDQGGTSDGEVLALRQEVTSLQSSLASSEIESVELSERILLLEGQLADMNRLAQLSVESADLAAIESTLAEQNQAEGETVAITETAAEELIDNVDASNAIDEFLTSSDTADSSSESGAVADLSENDRSVLSGDATEAADETNVVIPVSDNSATSNDTQDKSILETIKSLFFEGGLWKVLAGLGALLVAGAGLLFLRRRRADEEFEISMLSIESNSHSINQSESTIDSASIAVFEGAGRASVAGGDKETSFLTVYSDSDAVVQADEVDPVAEADVYIAYGRDEQAEEVLLDGVASHPDRIDIKQKLLRLYHKRQNAGGFERIAEELYSQRAALSGNTWKKVCDMGREILPNNPLFELSSDDLNTVVDASHEKSTKGDSEPKAAAEPKIAADASDAADVAAPAETAPEAKKPNSNPPAADLAAPVATFEGVLTIEAESEIDVLSVTEDDSIQLINFDDGRSEISELDDVDIDALEFGDEDSESSDLLDAGGLDAAVEAASNGDDAEFLDFNVESADAKDLSAEIEMGENQDVSDLEIDDGYDEARTQFELAKVFVDLGDEDGARKILVDLVGSSDTSPEVLNDSTALLESIDS